MHKRNIKNIDTALRIYYENTEIGNAEIRELFGNLANSTILSMKNDVLNKMTERNIQRFRYHTVNTEVAFEVWGIDVEDLEKRRSKLIMLGLTRGNTSPNDDLLCD